MKQTKYGVFTVSVYKPVNFNNLQLSERFRLQNALPGKNSCSSATFEDTDFRVEKDAGHTLFHD
jgi:hypothetical protein